MTQFSDLGLSDKVLAAVETAGYKTPTPIQAEAIPHVLARRDLIGIAQTGTGKTASFVLPMLSIIENGRARARMPRTLIIEPTRELAAQVEENFNKYGVNHRFICALLIGGVSFDEQDRKLARGADVLIATPGRLLDHFGRGKLLLNGVEILVIDEADRMLDMGFIPDIERICKLITARHQTLFFSATMAPEIRRLTQQFLTNPVEVAVAPPSSTVKLVEQRLAATGRDPWEKRDTLRRLLAEAADLKNAIIFCNRKRDVATLARSLARHGFNAGALHGDMDQRARMAMLDSFRKGQLALLVASDVAARGLDIPEVSHIFNFDVPTHAEDYVHRIGRTGRAGRSGTAITLATPADSKYVGAIERLTGDRIAWMGAPLATGAVDTVEPRPGGREGGRRRGGRRGGTGQGRGNDTGTAGQRNNGANGAGHDRSANGGHREPQAVETRPAPQQAAARPRKAGGDRPAPARPGNTQKRNGRDRQDAPDLNALPAFLLRPVRPAKSAPE